jgi:hypothetical protein
MIYKKERRRYQTKLALGYLEEIFFEISRCQFNINTKLLDAFVGIR